MMRNLFARARANVTLSPGERALLKLIEGLLCAVVVAALPALAGALGHNGVLWSDVARTALAAGAVAVLLALAKYAKAHGDPALGDALAKGAAGLSDAAAGDGSPGTAAVPAQTTATPTPVTAP
ncbi:MAG: hypothetical protein ACRDHE_01415 [Ktedonobacterales bacterium]